MVEAVAGAINMASAHSPKSTWLFHVPSRCAKNSLMTGLLVNAERVMGVINSFPAGGNHDLHFRSLPDKPTNDVASLVRGNTAGNSKNYLFSF